MRISEKQKKKLAEFRQSVSLGNSLQYYLSEFLNNNFNQIKNNEDINFQDWINYIKSNKDLNDIYPNPSKVTFNIYRNFWFLDKFKKTYQEFYNLAQFGDKKNYLKFNINTNEIVNFPQKFRLIICERIYSILKSENEDVEIVSNLRSFILKELSYIKGKKYEYNNELDLLKEFIKNDNYKEAVDKYLNFLIRLVKKIKEINDSPLNIKRGIKPSKIKKDLKLPIGKNEIAEIIECLKGKFNLSFFYNDKELKWFQNKGIDINKVKKDKTRFYWLKQGLTFISQNSNIYEKSEDLGIEFFLKFVINEHILKHKTPSYQELSNTKYYYFIQKLMRVTGKKYNDLLEKAGLGVLHEYKYQDMNLEDIKKYYMEEIYPKLSSNKQYEKGIAVLIEDVELNYRGFLHHLYNSLGISYVEFVRSLSLKPQLSLRTELGKIFHEVLRYIIAEWNLKVKSYKYYSEVELLRPLKKNKIDGLIINSETFKNHIRTIAYHKINSIQKLIQNKEFILFDFTNIIYKEKLVKSRIFDRVLKYNRNPNKVILFIVGTNWPINKDHLIKAPKIINKKGKRIYSFDTFIISPNLFGELIGFNKSSFNKFNQIIQYNRNLNLEDSLNLLKELKEKNIQLYSTEELQEQLKKLGKIKNSLSEIFDSWNSYNKINERESDNKLETKNNAKNTNSLGSNKSIKSKRTSKYNFSINYQNFLNKIAEGEGEGEEEDDFLDDYLWLSPEVRNELKEQRERILEKLKEAPQRKEVDLALDDIPRHFENPERSTEIESVCSDDLEVNSESIDGESTDSRVDYNKIEELESEIKSNIEESAEFEHLNILNYHEMILEQRQSSTLYGDNIYEDKLDSGMDNLSEQHTENETVAEPDNISNYEEECEKKISIGDISEEESEIEDENELSLEEEIINDDEAEDLPENENEVESEAEPDIPSEESQELSQENVNEQNPDVDPESLSEEGAENVADSGQELVSEEDLPTDSPNEDEESKEPEPQNETQEDSEAQKQSIPESEQEVTSEPENTTKEENNSKDTENSEDFNDEIPNQESSFDSETENNEVKNDSEEETSKNMPEYNPYDPINVIPYGELVMDQCRSGLSNSEEILYESNDVEFNDSLYKDIDEDIWYDNPEVPEEVKEDDNNEILYDDIDIDICGEHPEIPEEIYNDELDDCPKDDVDEEEFI